MHIFLLDPLFSRPEMTYRQMWTGQSFPENREDLSHTEIVIAMDG